MCLLLVEAHDSAQKIAITAFLNGALRAELPQTVNFYCNCVNPPWNICLPRIANAMAGQVCKINWLQFEMVFWNIVKESFVSGRIFTILSDTSTTKKWRSSKRSTTGAKKGVPSFFIGHLDLVLLNLSHWSKCNHTSHCQFGQFL